MKRKSLIFLTVAAAALVFVSAAWALRFTDESYSTPVGTVGSPYSFAFTGAGGCGPALPYQYSLIGGSLPRRRQPPSGPESSSDSRSESRAEPRA